MTDALKLALEALEANDNWHQDHDDHDGYPGSELDEQNGRAIKALRAALAAPQPAAPAQVEVFSEHDKGILRDLEAMAADKSSGFWPEVLAFSAHHKTVGSTAVATD